MVFVFRQPLGPRRYLLDCGGASAGNNSSGHRRVRGAGSSSLSPSYLVHRLLRIEGIVRLLAAGVNGTVFGILPLFLLERSYSFLSSRQNKSHSPAGHSFESDLLSTRTDAEGEILEIRSLEPKEGWIPPKIVRFQGVYYSLFQAYEERATSRYLVYVLRRLSAGVHSWTVLDYSANFRWADAEESNPKH